MRNWNRDRTQTCGLSRIRLRFDIRLNLRLGTILALSAISLPALATRRMTIEQLMQALASDSSLHRTDNEVARQLGDVQLTVRLNSSLRRQLIADSPGPKSVLAIRALADSSAFLEPAPEDLSSKPAPDVATQKAMMSQVVHFVARTLPTLPNLTAMRVTQHFVDTIQGLKLTGSQDLNSESAELLGGLYLSGTNRTPIALRDGRETDDPTQASDAAASLKKASQSKDSKAPTLSTASLGLASWGEFGPILGIVLVDAAKGKLGWARWEQEDGKPVAVFQFAVDRSISHYIVQYWHENRGEIIDSHYGARQDDQHGGASGVSAGEVRDRALVLIRQPTGYHGYIAVDPVTGIIQRISIEADLKPDDPIQRAAISVEYGPVKIGDGVFTCPTHSVAVSASNEQYQSTPTSAIVLIREQQWNDVDFTSYRRFGSESTMITDVPPAHGASDPASASTPNTQPASESNSAIAASVKIPANAPETAPETPLANLTASSASPTSAPAVVPAESSDEEILVKAVDSLPGVEDTATSVSENLHTGNPKDSSFTLKVTTRFVDLGLIATDKHGKPITDLKQDEIEIYDNGRKQQVAAFQHATPGATAAKPAQSAEPSQPSGTDSGAFTNTVTTVREVQDAPDLLILLMDESHLAFQDLNRARGEVLRFLKATRPTSRVALYSVSEHGFRVIQDVTQDHALVMAKLAAWMPNAQAVSQAQALDRRIRQQFDTVHNASDLNSVNGNYIDTPDYITSADPELRQMGQTPLRSSMEVMVALARHFSAVPGHKSLAWISGDSVLADWEDQAVGMEKGTNHMEDAMMHAKEALNEAHIALYAVDASSVEGAAIDSSLKNRNVELNPIAQENASSGGGAGRVSNGGAGRIQAEMQQDLHGIQGPVRQLAESTGGRAINKGGDLKALLDSIDSDSAALYEVGFDPDTQADGKFHTLLVKVPGRKDIKLRYRTGYLYAEESTSTKQRFQEAIWSPQDATAVTLTAEAVPAADSPSGSSMVRLRIAFPGLALQQKADTGAARWTDLLYIFVAQRDDAAQKAEVSGDTLRLSLKQATYDSGMPAGIPYQRAVEAKSKLGTVRIIVVDGNSGKMGSVTLPSSALHP
ncbi:VWA domain-containing protein [Acidicapsa acidisoli]|uniref:VWA domain-containing protein n=1 Tax=Acidicapsa acidisoli TaxID=1615681 RepID=UPI0021DFC79F|nr:VWA domain-containing protein [Acidicapsa acidisoli]